MSITVSEPEADVLEKWSNGDRAAQAFLADGDSFLKHVDRVLRTEHGRWLSSSIDRLLKFGYRLDTF
jgi:hypothetical protein